MSRLLEILGSGMTVDPADLIWHWFSVTNFLKNPENSDQQEQLSEIVELMAQNKTVAADRNLRLYLFENPDCTLGRLAAAAICLADNQINAAIEQLNSVYLRQPNNTIALYVLGHCYERIGKDAEAVEFYQDCLKFKNYLLLPRLRLAAIYFKNGQLEKTLREYQLLITEYPDDISALITLGHLYIASRRYEDAVDIFNKAILIHPDNFNNDDDIDQLLRLGSLEEASEQLDDLLLDQPDNARLLARRADILARQGATSEAVEQYAKAVEICPDFLEANIKLGTQYLHLNQHQLAAQQFNTAAEINEKIVDAYIGLAIAHSLAEQDSTAKEALSLAVAIEPNTAFLFAETATLQFTATLRQSWNFEPSDKLATSLAAVIGAHQKQIKQRPQNPDLHHTLGILLMASKRMDQAAKAFQAALDLNPTHARARNKLAICLFETGQKDIALKQLIGPNCLDKDTLQLHYKTALLYCDKLKFASTLLNLERQMESNFTVSDATVNVSIVLQNLGLVDRATATWDSLLQTDRSGQSWRKNQHALGN